MAHAYKRTIEIPPDLKLREPKVSVSKDDQILSFITFITRIYMSLLRILVGLAIRQLRRLWPVYNTALRQHFIMQRCKKDLCLAIIDFDMSKYGLTF